MLLDSVISLVLNNIILGTLHRHLKGLSAISPSTLRALPNTWPPPSTRTLQLSLEHTEGRLPTHALVVVDRKNPRGKTFPMHSLVYAFHCGASNIPLPADRSSPVPFLKNEVPTITIPLVAIEVPHLESFQTLHRYIYTHDQNELYRNLVPDLTRIGNLNRVRWADPKTIASECVLLAQTVERTMHPDTIIEMAEYLHGFWRNVNKFGVADKALWDVLDFSWLVVVGALESLTLRGMAPPLPELKSYEYNRPTTEGGEIGLSRTGTINT